MASISRKNATRKKGHGNANAKTGGPGQKGPKKHTRSQAEADLRTERLYREMLDDLDFAMEAATEESEEVVEVARALSESLKNSSIYQKAKQKVLDMQAHLRELAATQKKNGAQMLSHARDTLRELTQEAQKRIASAREDAIRQRERDALDRKLEEENRRIKAKSLSLYAEYVSASRAFGKAAISEIKSLRTETLQSQLDQLNESIADLDAIEEKMDAEESEREKERKAKAKEKAEADRINRLRREVAQLNHSLIRRMTVDPLVDKMSGVFHDALESIKEKTGISAVSRFLASERERREEYREKKEELDRLTLSAARAKLVSHQTRIKDAIAARLPVGSVPVSDLPTGTNPQAEFYKSFLPSARVAPQRTTPAGNTPQSNSYVSAQNRDMEMREIHALESMAAAIKGLKGRSKGLMDFLASPFGLGLLGAAGSWLARAMKALAGGMLDKGVKLLKWLKESITESKVYGWIKDKLVSLGETAADIKAFFSKKWESVTEALTGIKGFITKKFGWIFNSEKATDLARRARTAVTGAVNTAKSLVSPIGDAAAPVSEVASKPSMVSRVLAAGGDLMKSGADTVRSVAGTVGSAASKVGGAVYDTAATMGKGAASLASAGWSKISDYASTLAKSARGSKILSFANKLGNAAMAVSVASGVYEEATGKPVDALTMWDAVLDPMKSGRYLGAKFNKLFEKRMGQSFGSWVYDKVNPQERAIMASIVSSTPAMSAPGGPSTPVQQAQRMSMVPEAVPAAPSRSGMASPNSLVRKTSGPTPGQAASNTPALSVAGIPELAIPGSSLTAYNVWGM